MNWDTMGALGKIVGAIAVIATLVYLARQVRQSVGFARVSQNRLLVESDEDINDLIVANPAVTELLAGLEQEGNVISAAENIRARHLAARPMNFLPFCTNCVYPWICKRRGVRNI